MIILNKKKTYPCCSIYDVEIKKKKKKFDQGAKGNFFFSIKLTKMENSFSLKWTDKFSPKFKIRINRNMITKL